MRRSTLFGLLFAAVVAVGVPLVTHAAALFTIGPDDHPLFPVPRVLNQLPTTAPVSAAPLATLGGGLIGFNGGLAYNTVDSLLYAIGNDSSGDSTLYSMTTLGGRLTSIGPGLGIGFDGGLAYVPDAGGGKLYAIANDLDISGTSILYEVSASGVATPLGSIGDPFYYRGLTYNADDGKLYAIARDSNDIPRSVVSIDIASVTASAPLFDLSDGSLGFEGGLAYDAAADLFYVIGNDFFLPDSTLFSFTLAGNTSPGDDLAAIGSSFGQGFRNISLALAPAVTPPPPPTVSEPPMVALIALVGMLGWAARRTRRGQARGRRL